MKPATMRKRDYAALSAEGAILARGDYLRCANEILKRFRAIAKGATGYGKEPSSFAYEIRRADGSPVTKHAITVLS